MIFATDLDNTMIFSYKRVYGLENELICVEYYNGKPMTYITHTAIKLLRNLLNKIYVIPITTRSISQLKRISLFSTMEYAVSDNGGVIYHNGVTVPEWDNYINTILKRYDFQTTLKIFNELPNLMISSTIVDGKFIVTKSSDVDRCKKILGYKLDTGIWKIVSQGQKIYAIPKEINKGNALRYISEHLIPNNRPIISAGDGTLDFSMLVYSDYSIIPTDCSLATLDTKKFIKYGSDIYAADAILSLVTKLFDLQNY